MLSVSDLMRNHINEISNTKCEMIRNGTWIAETLLPLISKMPEVEYVECSHDKRKLYIYIYQDNALKINTLDQGICNKIWNVVMKETNTNFSMDNMGYLSVLPESRLIILNI